MIGLFNQDFFSVSFVCRIEMLKGECSLSIEKTNRSDSGWYTCTAFNSAGRVSCRCKVQVSCESNLYYQQACDLSGFFFIPVFLSKLAHYLQTFLKGCQLTIKGKEKKTNIL